MKLPILPTVAALAIALSACSSIGIKQTLESEATELREVRSELDASWSSVEARVANIERDIDAFGPDRTDLSGVDAEVIREDILNQTDASVTEAGGVQGETVDVEAAYEDADAETRAEVEAMRAEAKRIMAELRTGIPTAIADVAGQAAEAAVDAARIRASADQQESIGESNPLMSSADRAEARSNRAAIDRDSDALVGFADEVVRDSAALSTRLADALTRFEAKVAGIGQE